VAGRPQTKPTNATDNKTNIMTKILIDGRTNGVWVRILDDPSRQRIAAPERHGMSVGAPSMRKGALHGGTIRRSGSL